MSYSCEGKSMLNDSFNGYCQTVSGLGQGLTGGPIGNSGTANTPIITEGVCPNCGYCRHYGRKNYDTQPYQPYWPYQPYVVYSNPLSTTTWIPNSYGGLAQQDGNIG